MFTVLLPFRMRRNAVPKRGSALGGECANFWLVVWNGISADLSRLAGSGRNERPDLRFVSFRDVGRNTFYGTDGFWGWSPCGMCGGYFKSTSIGKLDVSGRGLKGTVVFLVGPGEKKEDGGLSHPFTLDISSGK